MNAPLILTATLDDDLFDTVNALRLRYFPPALNKIPAHVTLFHALPGDELEFISAELVAACANMPVIPAALPTLRFLGKGTAAELVAPALVRLRNELAERWIDTLSPQDRQKFKPHVTLQNKVDPATARATFQRLTGSWQPVAGRVVGLTLWHYRGGPWEPARTFEFSGG